MKRILPVLLLAGAGMAGAQTAPAGQGVTPYLALGLTGGGKTLVTVTYNDGSSQSIKAGGMVELVGGAEFRLADAPVSLRATVAYHVDDTNASNGSVRFSRWPIELVGLWRASDLLRLGLGVRSATSAKLGSSGVASGLGSTSFDSDGGLVIEGEYSFNPRMTLALRYVDESYKPSGGGAKIDGSHLGLRLGWYFR